MMHGTYNVKLRDSFFLDSPRIIENHVIKIGPDQKKPHLSSVFVSSH